MPASEIQFEQWVPFPVETIFRFFANPQNLPRIMPPTAATRVLELRLVPPPGAPVEGSALAGVGSEIVTSFRVFPYLLARAEWIAEITEFEWNHHFADVQRRGPFHSFHHRHEFSAESRASISGTVIRDVITYDVGFDTLGRLADRLFVRRRLQQTFAYRQQALEKLLL